jgi:dihydroorotate dehydrogenase
VSQLNTYQRAIFPALKRLDPESAHERTLDALVLAQRTVPGRAVLQSIAGEIPQQPVQFCGLTFPNVLGIAAGFDKDIRVAPGLALLGFGHIEVGTVTPQPQMGNRRPRIFRLPADEALINRMGFPSSGMLHAQRQLQTLPQEGRSYIIGVSLGKQKETPLGEAVNDYLAVMRAVYGYADYLAVNVSSPNTPELRALQGRAYIGELLRSLAAENADLALQQGLPDPRPLLVKIAPDLTRAELQDVLQAVLDSGVDGLIATNTTLSREGLSEDNRAEVGGMSGRPLAPRSLAMIETISRETGGSLPLIGVGGIRSAADVRAHLNAGASLVQLYTALIYQGPGLAGQILRRL